MEVQGAGEGYFNQNSDKARFVEEPLKKYVPDSQPLSMNGCFDCNICLDFATDPVVTLCGHLYCWPCIYKWLEIKSTDPRQCPVCKASLSRDALVPLYGRGNTSIDTKNSSQSPEIPKRPRPGYSPSDEFDIDHHHYDHHHNYQYQYYSGGSPPHWPTETSVFRSTAGGVIEGIAVSILPSMFQDRDSIYYSRPQLISENNPRLRRQEIQAERSLNQLWSFLCCSAIVFLLLF